MPFDRALCSTSDRARKRPRLFLSYFFVYLFLHSFLYSFTLAFISFFATQHNNHVVNSALLESARLDISAFLTAPYHTAAQSRVLQHEALPAVC